MGVRGIQLQRLQRHIKWKLQGISGLKLIKKCDYMHVL